MVRAEMVKEGRLGKTTGFYRGERTSEAGQKKEVLWLRRPTMSRWQYCLRQGWILNLLLLFWVICASGCAGQTAAPPAADDKIAEKPAATTHHILRQIRVIDMEVHFDLLRAGSQDIYYSAFKAIDPLRLVLDLPNTVKEGVTSPLAVENEIIGKIETMTLVHESQPLTRIEIGLNRDTAYLIDQAQEQIWVKFYADLKLTEAAAAQGEPVVHPEGEEYSVETKTSLEADAPQPSAEEPIDTPQAYQEEAEVTSQPSEAEAVDTSQPSEVGAVETSQPIAVEKEVTPQSAVTEALIPASRILDIQPVTSGKALKVYIIGNGKLDDYDVLVLKDPSRLVVDLKGVKSTNVKDVLLLTGPWVRKIRVGLHADKVRVVFDLNISAESEIPYKIIAEEDRLMVSFEPGSGSQ